MAGANFSPDAGAAYKDRVRDMWRRRGPGYDVNNALQPPLCRKLVHLAEVPPGATILDVCTGTGFVAFDAAMQAGPDGKVLGIDISEAMLEQARAKKADMAAGSAPVEFLVRDAEAADLPDAAFDLVLCSNGMAYLEDKDAAAAKFRRWLRPGGRLAFNNPLAPMIPVTPIITRLAAERYGASYPDAGGALGSEENIRRILGAAGYTDIQVTQSAEERPSKGETPEEFANWAFNLMRDFPTAPMHLQLSDTQIEELRAAYLPEAVAMAEGWRREEGVVSPYTMLWALATA
jgi:ubiquinone/menaquinone biosynthesis C-methylase UbiE